MPGHEEALATSARIAAMVEPHYESFGLGTRCFPSFQPARGKTPEDYLRELCEEGLRDRYGETPPPRRASGSTTSWASSTGWVSPRIS